MNVLIVHAHNEPQSFCTALKNTAINTLEAQGHTVVVSDLYAMNWNPVASASDFGARQREDYLVYALEQRHNFEAGQIAPDIAAEVAKVQACDLLIFNFPLYWFSVPAILKGWIDRVLISGVFYGGRRIYGKGGMVGKRATLTLTTGGRDHMFSEGSIHGELNTLLKPVLQGTLGYCGFEVLPPFAAYHVPYVDDASRKAMLTAYEHRLTHLDELVALPMPNLDMYDKELKPVG